MLHTRTDQPISARLLSRLRDRLPRPSLLALCLTFGLLATAGIFAAAPAFAQQINLDFGEGGTLTGRIIQMIMMITVLSLAPGILVTITSFTRLVIVMSMLRSAMGTQQSPPNMVVISLALFLTSFIMAPTFEEAWETGIGPMIEEEIDEVEGLQRAIIPFKKFMLTHAREKDLLLFFDMKKQAPPDDAIDTPLQVLMPAFIISELKRAFEIGFLLYIPFIVIDMVVASILMSMGMMMLPPVLISMPFKLIFFVLVDGWHLVVGTLVRSFTG